MQPGNKQQRRHDDEFYDGPERRRSVHLTEAQMADIAERAAELAVQRMIDEGFRAVGKTVVEKALWVIGLCATGLFALAVGKGWIKL